MALAREIAGTAPDGAGLLWIQLQELPWRVKGDAAGELDVGEGVWSERLKELRRPVIR